MTSIVLLLSALLIAGLMILQLRDDRDEAKAAALRQSERITQLEAQMRNLGIEPAPDETTVSSPAVVVNTGVRAATPTSSTTQQPISTSVTPASSTTSTTSTTVRTPSTTTTTSAPASVCVPGVTCVEVRKGGP